MATFGDRTVVGFYTLSNAVVEKHRLTRSTRDRVPGYVSVPATLLGRMGIDRSIAGRGYGTDLVIDAAHRALVAARSISGSSLLVVDAKSDALIGFYTRLGFASLPRRSHDASCTRCTRSNDSSPTKSDVRARDTQHLVVRHPVGFPTSPEEPPHRRACRRRFAQLEAGASHNRLSSPRTVGACRQGPCGMIEIYRAEGRTVERGRARSPRPDRHAPEWRSTRARVGHAWTAAAPRHHAYWRLRNLRRGAANGSTFAVAYGMSGLAAWTSSGTPVGDAPAGIALRPHRRPPARCALASAP
jgi:hypothetical protein